MKMFIFLIFVAVVVSAFVWRTRKARHQAELVRRKSLEAKRKRQKEQTTSEEDTIWPVIIRPVSGRKPDEAGEPTMTAIEFEPPNKMAG